MNCNMNVKKSGLEGKRQLSREALLLKREI